MWVTVNQQENEQIRWNFSGSNRPEPIKNRFQPKEVTASKGKFLYILNSMDTSSRYETSLVKVSCGGH